MPEMSGKTIKQVGVIGVPTKKGQPKVGTETGPMVLRKGGILDRLEDLEYEVKDYGDVEYEYIEKDTKERLVKNPRNVGMTTLKTAERVASALKTSRSLVCLGGDHSMAIGTMLGHARARPDMAVLWIDAHADINTPLTSESGNIHGMPISFLSKELEHLVPKLPGWEGINPQISLKNLAYIGLRDVDKGERKIIEKFGVTSFSMQEVDRLGIHEVITRALKAIDPEGVRPIHVSFDVDSMEPSVCPSTGTPVAAGLSLRELHYIGETIAATGRLSVLDIAEVNPLVGTEENVKTTVENVVSILGYFYGDKRQGIFPSDYEIPIPSSERIESR